MTPHQTATTLAGFVAYAEAAVSAEQARQADPGDLIRAEPGCELGCPRCKLRCAIMRAGLADMRRRLRQATGEEAFSIRHAGRLYVASEGRA